MSDSRGSQIDFLERIHRFVVAGESNELADDQWTDFEQFLWENDDACRLYVEYTGVSVLLPTVMDALPNKDVPSAVVFPGPAIHNFVGYFSSGWPVAYLVATVIFGIGLLVGSHVYVSDPVQVAQQSASLPSPLSPLPKMVGRITGMVDCQGEGSGFRVQGSGAVVSGQWSVASGQNKSDSMSTSHQSLATGHLVALGDTFALASGLMEITYDTGAKVILQGPVRYEVESAAGGFLSVGKLTARVGGGGRGTGDEGMASLKSPNLQISKSPNSNPQSLIPNPLFSVRTPTATVIDLGTEFGVEVSKEGHTTSHVFRGSVRLQVTSADGKVEGITQVLHENESARVENRGNRSSDNRIVMLGPSVKPTGFVREISKRTIKVFDLVDVVAGGDGFSGRRNRGINPTTGEVVTALWNPPPPIATMPGDGHYHRVASMPFVDGVFIPDGRAGPVQVDSAGHVFDGFLATANVASQYIWAGGPLETPTELGEVDYALPPHGLLFLPSNNAITFDLEAIRWANCGFKLLRFRAVAANTAPRGFEGFDLADIRVLIDGNLWFQRRQIRNEHGVFSVLVPIHDHDRFLTLSTTDGGDGVSGDWIVFGDPRLELLPLKAAPDPVPQEKTPGELLPQPGAG